MYVFATQRKWSTLLGVFSTKEKALTFWNSLSSLQREVVEPIEVEGLAYRFVVIEFQDFTNGVNAFEFYTYDEYRRFKPPEDGSSFEIYFFDEDWNSSCDNLHAERGTEND